MNAHDKSILSLVDGTGQFIIPIFQRPYRWHDDQCLTLLHDIEHAAESADGERHFLGSIVHRPEIREFGFARSVLIDGQQRLTTITLILCALRELNGKDPQRRGQLDDWLVNSHRSGSQRYKLILRDADRDALRHIVDHGSPKDGDDGTVARRYRTLREAMESLDPEKILRGLDRTCHVDVVLEARDNHQAIFESLNAKFEPLSLIDKVRNFAMMGLDDETMTRVWENPWRVVEDRYGGEDNNGRKADAFVSLVRDLLALAGPRERRKNEDAYAQIKRLAHRSEERNSDGRIRFVEDLAKQAKHHAAFTLGIAAPHELIEPLARCRRLSDTPGPVVLRLLGALRDTLSVNDVRKALLDIESVLVRRRCCGWTSGAERNAFARIGRMLKPRCKADDVTRAFSRVLRGSRRPPDDAEFSEALVHRAMPRGGQLVRHVLERLENYGKEKVKTDSLTIEHVLPQTQNLPTDWQEMLGDDWKGVHARCVQRLGNLTLTGYNSELGARPLKEKQTMDGGYGTSKVGLNKDIADIDTWNEAQIEARGRRMAGRALTLWPPPDSAVVPPPELELDPGAGGPILKAGDGWRAWRKRGDVRWTVEQNGFRLQQAVVAALLRLDQRGAQNAAMKHPFVLLRKEQMHAAIEHEIEGFIYHNMSQIARREWLEDFADEIETDIGTPPVIGSDAEPADIDVWLPTSPGHSGSTASYPLASRRLKAVEASVNQSRTLDLNDSGQTLQASLSSRAWRPKDGSWKAFGSATATLSSLARWLADQDRRGPEAFYSACPWHFTRGATNNAGKAKVVDLDRDVMLAYEHLGTYPACRDFAWRMCRQVETETGELIILEKEVELWMPDSTLQEM